MQMKATSVNRWITSPFSLTKLRLASVSLQDWDDYAFMSTLLPIFRYHDRWKDLNAADFQHFSQDPYNPYKGASPVYTEIEFTGDLDYMAYTDETEPLKDKAVDYLGRIKALCDEEGIEQLHLIKTPTALSWNYARSSAVKAVADELDIPYTDYNFHIEQMGVDWTKDALTDGGARLNAQGMEKFPSISAPILSGSILSPPSPPMPPWPRPGMKVCPTGVGISDFSVSPKRRTF